VAAGSYYQPNAKVAVSERLHYDKIHETLHPQNFLRSIHCPTGPDRDGLHGFGDLIRSVRPSGGASV
jgi:hypothetical protein